VVHNFTLQPEIKFSLSQIQFLKAHEPRTDDTVSERWYYVWKDSLVSPNFRYSRCHKIHCQQGTTLTPTSCFYD